MREAAEIQRKQEQRAIEERKNAHIQVSLVHSRHKLLAEQG